MDEIDAEMADGPANVIDDSNPSVINGIYLVDNKSLVKVKKETQDSEEEIEFKCGSDLPSFVLDSERRIKEEIQDWDDDHIYIKEESMPMAEEDNCVAPFLESVEIEENDKNFEPCYKKWKGKKEPETHLTMRGSVSPSSSPVATAVLLPKKTTSTHSILALRKRMTPSCGNVLVNLALNSQEAKNRSAMNKASPSCSDQEKVKEEAGACKTDVGSELSSTCSPSRSNNTLMLFESYEPNSDEHSDFDFTEMSDEQTLERSASINWDHGAPTTEGGKRKCLPEKWKKNVQKLQRNLGKAYEMHNKEKLQRSDRKMKPTCGTTCRLKCFEKINEDERRAIFASYWNLGDINKQRQYISNSMEVIKPAYRYVREGGQRRPRGYNNAFFFHTNDRKIRVCKLFFKNTLDINDRPIRTVIDKRSKSAGTLVEPDQRGKHGMQVKIDQSIRDRIKAHIDSIPKIESHYARANTSKSFIDRRKTIVEIYNDYVVKCKEENVPSGNYNFFYKIFTHDYNCSLPH